MELVLAAINVMLGRPLPGTNMRAIGGRCDRNRRTMMTFRPHPDIRQLLMLEHLRFMLSYFIIVILEYSGQGYS